MREEANLDLVSGVNEIAHTICAKHTMTSIEYLAACHAASRYGIETAAVHWSVIAYCTKNGQTIRS